MVAAKKQTVSKNKTTTSSKKSVPEASPVAPPTKSTQKAGKPATTTKPTAVAKTTAKASKTVTIAPTKASKTKGKAGKGSKTKKVSEVNMRSFRLFDPKTGEVIGGRYRGRNPRQAASKAYTKLLKSDELDGSEETTLHIKESTRGGNRRIFAYSANREELKNPQKVELVGPNGPRVICYRFKNRISKIAIDANVSKMLSGVSKTKKSKKSEKKSSKKAVKKVVKKAVATK